MESRRRANRSQEGTPYAPIFNHHGALLEKNESSDSQTAATFRGTRIIDSTGIHDADEAYFEKLDNGDDLEIGTTGCPHKNGAMTDYEEIWRDITAKSSPTEPSWILQRKDGNAFFGKVGAIYLAIQQIPGGGFAVRREDREASSGKWSTSYETGDVHNLPSAAQAVEVLETGDQVWAEGQTVALGGSEYVVKGISTD